MVGGSPTTWNSRIPLIVTLSWKNCARIQLSRPQYHSITCESAWKLGQSILIFDGYASKMSLPLGISCPRHMVAFSVADCKISESINFVLGNNRKLWKFQINLLKFLAMRFLDKHVQGYTGDCTGAQKFWWRARLLSRKTPRLNEFHWLRDVLQTQSMGFRIFMVPLLVCNLR